MNIAKEIQEDALIYELKDWGPFRMTLTDEEFLDWMKEEMKKEKN